MSTLTYWYARCRDDSDSYSLVGRTKAAVDRQITDHCRQGGQAADFDPPKELHVEYRDAFHLFEIVTGEGGGRGIGNPS